MSKIDEKLEHFANNVMADVSDERRQIIEAVENELKGQYDKKELEYLGKAYDMIQEALIKIDQEKNEQLSKTIMSSKIKLLRKRNEWIDGMFGEAKDKLRAFTKTEDYMPYLLKLIEEAKETLGEGDLVISLNLTDKAIKEEVEKATGLKVTFESKKIDLIGGCKIYNESNNTIVDYSFARKLEDQKADFINKCRLDVE